MSDQAEATRRTMNFCDIDAIYSMRLDDAGTESLAKPVIDALKSLQCDWTADDFAGIPLRGGWVYREAIEGRFTMDQLCAARIVLMRRRAAIHLIDVIESTQAIAIA